MQNTDGAKWECIISHLALIIARSKLIMSPFCQLISFHSLLNQATVTDGLMDRAGVSVA